MKNKYFFISVKVIESQYPVVSEYVLKKGFKNMILYMFIFWGPKAPFPWSLLKVFSGWSKSSVKFCFFLQKLSRLNCLITV